MPIIHNAQKFGTYRKIAVKAAASGAWGAARHRGQRWRE